MRKLLYGVILVLVLLILIVLSFSFVIGFSRVSSRENNNLFPDNTWLWVEKVSYRFRDPQVGEFVVFNQTDGNEWIGLVLEQNENNNLLIATNNQGYAWIVPADKVFGKVISPQYNVDPSAIKSNVTKIYTDPRNPNPTIIPSTN